MKKILAFLLAVTGFGFAACDRDNDDQYICLYGVRSAEYQESGAVCEAPVTGSAAYSQDCLEESASK